MKTNSLFDLIASKLEEATSFNRLEARGTLRIVLKEAGLDIKSLKSDQMKVAVEKFSPSICSIGVSMIPR